MIRLLSPVDMLGVPESYIMEGILSGKWELRLMKIEKWSMHSGFRGFSL